MSSLTHSSIVAPKRASASSLSPEPRERRAGPPVFSRDPKAAAGVKDKGIPRSEVRLAEYLRGMGPMALRSWANMPATGHEVNVPQLSGHEFADPSHNQQNPMLVYRVGNGLEVGPAPMTGDDDFERPHLLIEPTAGGRSVRYTLNGQVLNLMQAPLGDLELAADLVNVIRG